METGRYPPNDCMDGVANRNANNYTTTRIAILVLRYGLATWLVCTSLQQEIFPHDRFVLGHRVSDRVELVDFVTFVLVWSQDEGPDT